MCQQTSSQSPLELYRDTDETVLRVALYAVCGIIGGVLFSLFGLLLTYYCGFHLHCKAENKGRLIDPGINPKVAESPASKRTSYYAENETSSVKNASLKKSRKPIKKKAYVMSEV